MSKIRRYTFGDLINDSIDTWYYSPWSATTYSLSEGTRKWVDTNKFDLIPKQAYLDEQIATKGEEIEALKRQHESHQRYYEERLKTLNIEKEQLEQQRKKREL